MDYTTLSLAEATTATRDVADDAEATFGGLDARQLNWTPDAARWSVAQCFAHLLAADRLMLQSATEALRTPSRTLWQRVPLLPGLWGRMLIRSQSPDAARAFTAPAKARPASSDVPGDVVRRFADHQRATAAWMQTFGESDAAGTIMVSPFLGFVTYSVLDGCRLIAAHDRRHVEQARRVTTSPGFPSDR